MIRRVSVALVWLLVACGGSADRRAVASDSTDRAPAAPAPRPGVPDVPDTSTAPLRTAADTVVAVLRDYYDAIDRGDYARAYALWSDAGRGSGQSFAEFRRGFAQTAQDELVVGTPGRVEGAAGSRYIDVPVTLAARQRDGTVRRFRGHYVLRRVVVTGATPAEQRWHIYSARLTPVAADAPAAAR